MITENSFTESIRNLRRRGSRMEREGDYWEQDEKERLEEMFDDGIGLSEMAIRLQRTEPAVIQQIEKLDLYRLYRRKDHPKRDGNTDRLPRCLCPLCKVNHNGCPISGARPLFEEGN